MNIRRVLTQLTLIAATTVFLAGCLTDSTRQENPIPGVRLSSYGYWDHGSRLVYRIPTRINPSCNGNVPVYDTLPEKIDSLGYSLSGGILEWDYQPDSSYVGAVFQYYLRFSRVGSGTGLPGIWRKGRRGYKVVSGELIPERREVLDGNMVSQNLEEDYILMHLRITGDSLQVYSQSNFSGLKKASWTTALYGESSSDSSRWDMDFRIVDKNTVEYHGRKTGETVRVARFDNNDVDYSSDDPSHPAYHYSDKPETCPDDFQPDWYSTFQSANAKDQSPLPKAQIQPNSVKHGHQVPAPLKFRGFFLN
jgi:hypothetical protein